MNPVDRHDKIALQLSGGKDSLACLYLMRPYWDKITVFWLNTGAAPPQSVKRMMAIKAMVPNFVEWVSNQPGDIAINGYPVDVLPLRATSGGSLFEDYKGVRLQPYMACCANNLWIPMRNAMKELGITLIIRGQRDNDHRRSPIKSGQTGDGFELYFPIEDWTQEDVFAYLALQGVDVPPHYSYGTSSVDCWDCTAYLYENAGRGAYLRDHEPELYPKFITIMKQIRSEVVREANFIEDVING
jgi:3'-phosphoadenosine 5'-phosphosulfate sulfotransferase (PAPS reductase)/FAD synthetase